MLVRIGPYIIGTRRATSQTSLPISFTEVLVSFNRCALLRYLHTHTSERTISPTGLFLFHLQTSLPRKPHLHIHSWLMDPIGQPKLWKLSHSCFVLQYYLLAPSASRRWAAALLPGCCQGARQWRKWVDALSWYTCALKIWNNYCYTLRLIVI